MKPLKILLGNQTYNLLAGSETWSKTLAYQLQKAGHSVEAFSPQLGIISNEMVKKGIKCLDRIFTSGIMPFSIVLEEKNAFDYDVIIANHTDIVYHLRSQFPSTPIISTIHGVLHWQDDDFGNKVIAPEHPAVDARVNQFVAVSEEVKEKLKKDYDLESIIIRNFFDIDSLQPKRNINPIKPSTFLVNTNYSLSNDPDVEVIRKVSKHYGAKLVAIGQNFSLNPNVMQAIEEADIVVGMGRSVLEGVCAGRLGIVHGRWGTGGIICKESIVDIQKCNFSGRNSKGVFYTVEQMISEIDKHYNQNTIEWGVQYVKVNHNVVTAADMFVTIARELLGQSTSETPLEIIRPYRRARDVN